MTLARLNAIAQAHLSSSQVGLGPYLPWRILKVSAQDSNGNIVGHYRAVGPGHSFGRPLGRTLKEAEREIRSLIEPNA